MRKFAYKIRTSEDDDNGSVHYFPFNIGKIRNECHEWTVGVLIAYLNNFPE